jgi:serine/threonine-protein kinase
MALAKSAGDTLVGTTLGGYRLVRLIGFGAAGAVFEAEGGPAGRAALKLLATADPKVLARFGREAMVGARLRHPNLIEVYGSGGEGGRTFLAMELMTGGSMAERLSGRGLPWKLATRWAADACRALTAAHAAGLVHRDIKPGNLMLSAPADGAPDGVAKVGDWGMVRSSDPTLGRLTQVGDILGTPAYMSPEQAMAEEPTPASDIYSLAATYYEMLTGRPPFESKNPMEILRQHIRGPVPDPRKAVASVPEGCAAVVRRAMAKSPSARYASAVEMLAALEALASRP